MSEFNAGSIVGSLDLDRDPFTRGLEEARRQADEFSRRTPTVTPQVDTRPAAAEIERLKALLDEFARRTPTVTPQVDTAPAAAELAALQRQIDHLNHQRVIIGSGGSGAGGSSGTRQAAKDAEDAGNAFSFLYSKMGLVIQAAGSILPAIVPLTGALTLGSIALASGLTQALFAIGSFALVAKSDITDVSKALKAVGGDASKLPAQLRPLGNAIEQLHYSFAILKQQTSGAVDSALTQGIHVLTAGMSEIAPLINATARGLQMMFAIFQNFVQGPTFKRFIAMTAKEVGPALTGLGVILVNVGNAMLKLFMAAEPVLAAMGREAVKLSGSFDTWASSGASGFIQGLVRDFHQVEPLLKAVGQLAMTFVHILAPSSGPAVATLTAIITALNQMEPALQVIVELTQPFGLLIREILPALVPVINEIGRVADALLPIMNAVVHVFGVAFADAARLVLPLINDLLAAINPIVPVVVQLVNAFIPLVNTVFAALTPLIPPLNNLFQAMSGILIAVLKDTIPLVEVMTRFAGDVLPPLVHIVSDLVQWLADLLNALKPLAPVIVGVGVAWAAIKIGGWISAAVAGLRNMLAYLPGILTHLRAWVSYNLGTSQGLAGIAGGIGKLAAIGGSIFVVASVFKSWADAGKQAKAAIDGIKSSIDNFDLTSINSAITKLQTLNAQAVKGNSGGSLVVGALNDATFHLFGSSSALGNSATIKQSESEIAALRAQAVNLGLAYQQLGDQYNLTQSQVEQLAKSAHISLAGTGVGDVWKQLNDAEAAFRKVYGAELADLPITKSLTGNFASQSVEAQKNADKVTNLANVVEALLNKQESAIQASDAFHKSLNDLSQSIDANSHALVGSSDAAINNRGALITLVNEGEKAANTYAKGKTNSDAYKNALNLAIISIENQAAALGFNKSQVDALIKSLGLVPPHTPAKVDLNTGDASNALDNFEARLRQLAQPIIIPLEVQSSLLGVASPNFTPSLAQILATHRAHGGLLSGPGTGTSDSILLAASTGEFVMNAKSTAKHLPELEAMNAEGHYANGGSVGSGLAVTDGDALGAKLDTLIDLIRQSPTMTGDAIAEKFDRSLSKQTQTTITALRTL